MSATFSIPEQFWSALKDTPKGLIPLEAIRWPDLNPNAISAAELPRLLALAAYIASVADRFANDPDRQTAERFQRWSSDAWDLALWAIQELEQLQREAAA